jgi:hypothetical protein
MVARDRLTDWDALLDDPPIVDDRRRLDAPHRVREWMAGGR